MDTKIEHIDPIKPLPKRGFIRFARIFRSKYLLAGIGFFVWMLFFDKNDFFQQYERIQYVRELSKNEQHQAKQIAETKKELDFLITNAQTIEKYARERYMMKKDNEDLFILPSSQKPD
ncbi:MAG: FtsB family cell division protein [Ferruginibacter sp.]